MLNKWEYWDENEATCPYCGNKRSNSGELDDETTIDCDCGETFDVIRNVTVTYTSVPASDNKTIQGVT
jgi:hypothetical protein